MSVFDIAGVVLGGSSVGISGLGHLGGLTGVCKNLNNPRPEFERCLADADIYAVEYEDNLRDLLRPIVGPEEIVRLVKDPGGQDWKDDGLEVLLKRRLANSFEPCMKTIQQINEATLQLRKELFLDKPAIQRRLALLPPPDQTGNLNAGFFKSMGSEAEYAGFLFRFSCRKSTRDNLVSELKRRNGQFKDLLKRRNRVTSYGVDSRTPTDHTSHLEAQFEKSRKNSHHLYNALRYSLGYQSDESHTVYLRLQHQTTSAIFFNVILSLFDRLTDTWTCKEFDCYGVQGPNSAGTPTRFGDVESPAHPSFNAMGAPSTSTTTHQIELQALNIPRLRQCPEGRDIQDTTISHDGEAYSLQPRDGRMSTNLTDMVTLKDILHKDFQSRLNTRQRAHLAFLIASSAAQHWLTDWLPEGIKKENIFFIPRSYGDQAILYTEPFIRRGFKDLDPSPRHKDKWFLSLGILLLELWYDGKFEDQELYLGSVALDNTKETIQKLIALQMAENVQSETWARAIKWCLDNKRYGIERDWRSEIIKNVIIPLGKSHEYFEGSGADSY